MTDQTMPEMDDPNDKGYPEPPPEEDLREEEARAARRPNPRQPAHDAVYEYIRSTDQVPGDTVTRNAMIWRGVMAALDAMNVGRCISSHCVEGDHIIDLDEPTPPQDAPHAPQDGPRRPDAGAETPDGAGGRQAGAEPVDEGRRDRLAEWLWHNCGEDERSGLLADDPRKIATVVLRWPEFDNLARLRRLRDQLAAEHAKAVRADQQPRPDLDHLRVTAHNGIAAGLETAIFFVDHHLREGGEQPARTTVNNPAASGDVVGGVLRERAAEALRPWLLGADEADVVHCAGAVLAALDKHLDISDAEAWCKTCRRVWDGPRHRCETDGERQAAALRTALAEALACLYSLTRVGGSLIGYQTVNVISPARYDRWQAVLQAAGGGEQP